jgi:hypothetical protein
VDIYHDEWCDALTKDGFCNCEPEIRFVSWLGPAGEDPGPG